MKNIYIHIALILLGISANAQNQATNTGNIQMHTGATMTFFGDFVNNGTFTDGGQVAIFDGTTHQNISGSSSLTFSNLTIKNSAGVTLQQSIIVNNTLNLTSGALDLNSKMLTINNNSPSSISRTNGYIISEKTDNSGKLKWNIGSNTGTFIFPFGTASGSYIPFVLDITSGDIGNVTVSTYPTAADNIPYPTSPIIVTNINDINGYDNSANTADRFWQIDKDGPDGTASLTFTAAGSEIGSISNLMAQRWNDFTGGWDAPLPGQSNTATSVTVPNVTSFSPWILYGNNSPLPVELLNFEVKKINNYANLFWTTASEINNSGFEIEKSTNLKEWKNIGFVSGNGNSNILLQYKFNNPLDENFNSRDSFIYFRLKQIDFNGVFKYSEIRSMNLNYESKEISVKVNLFPNPATDIINIFTNTPDQEYFVKVLDSKGSIVINTTMTGCRSFDILHFKPDVYHIVLTNDLTALQITFI